MTRPLLRPHPPKPFVHPRPSQTFASRTCAYVLSPPMEMGELRTGPARPPVERWRIFQLGCPTPHPCAPLLHLHLLVLLLPWPKVPIPNTPARAPPARVSSAYSTAIAIQSAPLPTPSRPPPPSLSRARTPPNVENHVRGAFALHRPEKTRLVSITRLALLPLPPAPSFAACCLLLAST
ncbi:hypothetical protein L226DRAFT_170121 [Lentinus tigrinus ALCF2SS1-7]|uniref:uncharacterized protein n=1 Tax=Lentinus tigrinus ALCF2SS1-7 TaxID=1328758 RepID=UPI001165CAEE|nr:hypothetical protein L226DRAFT_170121 [Lentinus tigrinus ALCF2SS1-7]